jgi:D-alanyl-D-alanine carboxypeptidase
MVNWLSFRGLSSRPLRRLAIAAIVSASIAATSTVALAAQGAAIVVDSKSGKVLYSDNPDARRYPASLTKMMTLYLLFEAIENGRTNLNSRITVSAKAAGQAPSKLGIRPGQTISVRDAILALVTKSANDVAVAIAEHVGGTESAFAARMTAKAQALGMTRTTFRNASGLPNPGQVTTARDMATLGRALQDHFPQYYSYFSTRVFVFNGRRIGNHNRLLGRVNGVDGIKTGYTRASGFNLVTSVKRDNRSVVAVVLGGQTGATRDKRMANLVADYMPKATRGSRTAPIVAGGPRSDSAGEPIAIAQMAAPQPRARPILEAGPIMTASVIGANSPFAAEDEGDADAGDEDGASVASIAAAEVATPPVSDNPKSAAVTVKLPVKVASAAPAEVVSDADTGPAGMVPSGWKIQLGASPSRNGAESIIDKAKSKAPKLLAGLTSYTEPVVKGSTTLYRARFGGFADKDAARQACVSLTKQDFSCLALGE